MASRLLSPQEEPNAIAEGAIPNSQLRPMNLAGAGAIGGRDRVSPANPYLNPGAGAPGPGAPGPAGYGGSLDPSKEFSRGYMDDLINMLGTHDMSRFQSGPARKRYAEQYNAGMTKPQIDYNKMMYQRQKDEFAREASAKKVKTEQDEKDWETKMQTQAYIQARRDKSYDGPISSWFAMTPADRSKRISSGSVTSEMASSNEAFENVVERGMFDGDRADWDGMTDADKSSIIKMATRPEDFMSVEDMHREYDMAKYEPQSVKDAERHNDPALLTPKVKEWKGNKDQLAAQNSMRKEYKKEMAPIWSVQNSYNQTIVALNQATGAGDLAATVKFMKTLDPPSVVREGEQRMAQQVGGLKEQWLNTWEKWNKGDMLPETARAALAAMSKELVMLTKVTRDSLREEYIYNAAQGYLDEQAVIGKRNFDYESILEYTPSKTPRGDESSNAIDDAINAVQNKFSQYF